MNVFGRTGHPDVTSKPSRRQAQPVGALTGAMLAPALKARGFANMEIIARWNEIVGPQFAGRTRALQMKWPPRGTKSDPDAAREGAVLVMAAAGGCAIELQHMTPQIIERINATLGWRCVTGLQLRQQPVAQKPGRPTQRPPLSPQEAERLLAATAMVEDEKLREALLRLGKGVIQRNKSSHRPGPPAAPQLGSPPPSDRGSS